MFGFGHADRPQFGGVGLMIEPPAVEVTIERAAAFRATGALSDRTRDLVDAAAASWNLVHLPPCEVRVHSPPSHVGLGVGTQHSLAVAAGLRRFLRLPDRAAELLAHDVARGRRSSVGTFGFQHGGLIVDAGHTPGAPLGKLARRIAVPHAWRFVLACRSNQCGLSGPTETEAFSRLPPVPDDVTRQLWDIVHSEMVPALEQAECRAFGESVYRFGVLAGECFAAVQGGPFASREIALLVEAIRDFGIPGAGQSSWGPTVFAVCESETSAHRLCDWLSSRTDSHTYKLSIASPNNHGAQIEMV
jgi:beta-RFAP synthase